MTIQEACDCTCAAEQLERDAPDWLCPFLAVCVIVYATKDFARWYVKNRM